MHMQAHQDTARLAELASKLAQARAKSTEAEAELKKAERRAERAGDTVSALREEYDQERLRLWGSKPDIAALLESDGSMTFHYAAEAIAEAYGLGLGLTWSDTKQKVLHVRMNRGEFGAVDRAKAAVLFFAPFIKARKGIKRFDINHHEGSDFAVELWYSIKTGEAQVVRMCFGQETGTQKFTTLDAALMHVQETHWVEEFIEMSSATTMLA